MDAQGPCRGRIEALEAAATAARSRYVQLQREVLARRRADRRRRQRGKLGGFSSWASAVAIAVYVLSGHNAAAAGAYLLHKGAAQEREDDAADDDEDDALSKDPRTRRQRLVESWFLAAPVRQLVSAHVPQTPWEVRRRSAALTFLRDFDTVAWIGEQNNRKGIPVPLSAAACRHAATGPRRQAPAPESRGTPPRRSLRWLRRLRVRWGLRRKRLESPGPALSLEDIRRRAGRPARLAGSLPLRCSLRQGA